MSEEAAAAYRRAIALDPYDLQAHHRLARTHLALGAVDHALAACAAALAIDPFCQNALATRALAEQIGGDRDAGSGLYDFDRFVTRVSLTSPPGSGDIEALNEALATAVREAPSLVWEPPNRVTRNGAVTQDMLARAKPAHPQPGARAACRNRRLQGDADGRPGEPVSRTHSPALSPHADRLDPDGRWAAPAAYSRERVAERGLLRRGAPTDRRRERRPRRLA